jgi:hypothetical protein
MNTTRIGRRTLNAALALATIGLSTACMSSKRSEPAGAVAPTSASSGRPSQFAWPPPQTTPRSEERDTRKPEATPIPQAAAPAAAPESVPAFAAPTKASRASAAPAMGRARGEAQKPSAKDKKSGAADEAMLSRPDDMRVDPLVPTLADPPDIRTALQDFQGAAEMLSAGHGCDEGCRAFQSMQRAAARICDLVSSRDPQQRCALARTKVSSAEHDLKDRCGSC